MYQHNEQARAALKYSPKKPTRQNAKHQADERRKRHNKKRKHHTRDETDTTTMANRIWSIEAAVAKLRARSVRTLHDPTPTWDGTPGSRKVRTDLAIRMVLITTFPKDAGGKPSNHSRRSYGSDSKTPFPYLANDPVEPI